MMNDESIKKQSIKGISNLGYIGIDDECLHKGYKGVEETEKEEKEEQIEESEEEDETEED